MISGASLLRPPKPASEDAAQRAAKASAKGGDHARLMRVQAAMSGGRTVQRLQRAATALSGNASDAPVQMLKDGKGGKVDITTLSDDLVLRLAAAAVNGDTVKGYTFEAGDMEALKEENRRRGSQSQRKRKFEESDSSSDEEEEEEKTKGESVGEKGEEEEEKKSLSGEEEEEKESQSDEDFAMNSDDEAIHYLTTEGRFKAGLDKVRYDKEGNEKEGIKDWPQTGLQGALGEYEADRTMTKEGHSPTDLNVLALNFKGLDHLSAHPDKPLEQTKLHLSTSTATPETYLGHVKKAPSYAIKAVKDLKRHEATFKELMKQPPYNTNAPLQKLVKALGKLEGKSDDDIEGSEVHELVTGSMRFSIPSDIYDKIDPSSQQHFVRLGRSVSDFQKIMDAMKEDYVPSKEKGSKPKQDEMDYEEGEK